LQWIGSCANASHANHRGSKHGLTSVERLDAIAVDCAGRFPAVTVVAKARGPVVFPAPVLLAPFGRRTFPFDLFSAVGNASMMSGSELECVALDAEGANNPRWELEPALAADVVCLRSEPGG
jgi:hypothetical protein